jgi:hypothetical protein
MKQKEEKFLVFKLDDLSDVCDLHPRAAGQEGEERLLRSL